MRKQALRRIVEHEVELRRLDTLCARADVSVVVNCLRASEESGCLYWLQTLTQTEDDHWLLKSTPPKAPFPTKTYFTWVLGEMLRPVAYPSRDCQQLYIPKSREMMTSWLACGYIAWLCQWRPGIFFVIQTEKEEKATQLIRYIKILWENQKPWLQDRHPLAYENSTERGWKNGSRVLAVPKGENQIRVHHPFGYLADEAAFLPEFVQCVNAVVPVAKQIIAVSSAAPGPFGDECAR